MRVVCVVLAVVGGCSLVAAVAIELAIGDPAGAGWVLVGPAPFYAAGLIGVVPPAGPPRRGLAARRPALRSC